MIAALVLSVLFIGVLGLFYWLGFQTGWFSSQIMASNAMIRHHQRMIDILEKENRIPAHTETNASLVIMRKEADRDPTWQDAFTRMSPE